MIDSIKKLFSEKDTRGALMIAGMYLIASALWILWSDRLAARLAPSAESLTHISILKGWVFVLVTTYLLFWLIRSYIRYVQAEHETLQLIADALPAPLAYLDSERRYRFNNRAYEEWVGRSRGEIFGMQPTEVLGKAAYQQLEKYIDAALAGQRSIFEAVIPRANGQLRCAEITYIPDVRPDGRVAGFVAVVLDIEERKRTEEAIRASEARYRLLAENIADVVWLLNPAKMRFTFMSPSVERLRGYSVEEVMAQSIAETMTPESLETIETALPARLAAFASGDPAARTQTHEIEQYRKDGSTVWTEVVTALVQDPEGNLDILGVTRDITERKRAEVELREREALYRAVIETSSDGFLITDLKGQILEVNQAYIEQSGYGRDELLAMRLYDLTAHEPPERLSDPMASAIRRGSHIYEALHMCKDGTAWQVEVNVSYWPIHGGRLFAFVRDIRRRKRSEALLRARLQLSELARRASVDELMQYTLNQAELFTGSRIGFFHQIEEDQKNLSLQLWSTHTLKDSCQVTQLEMHYPIDQAGVWVDCLLTGAPVIHNDYNALAHRKGLPEGHAALTRMLTVPIMHAGRATAILGVGNKARDYDQDDVETVQELASIALDVVARKQAEEAAARYAVELEQRVTERTADLRRANAELEQASRSKDEFLASVSHELRTPLNAILTLTESLQEGAYDPLNERQLKPLHTIAESGYHLLNLINDLLDLSKIEAGKLGLQITTADIEPLCHASLRLVRQQAQNKNLQMSFHLDPAVKTIQTDPRRFKQMLVNLLSNAVKFTPAGGKIGLEVRGDFPAGAVRLTVWDTGIGITAEDARRLFQPFVQLDSGLDRQYGGTGLGLSLVHRMAELHGGSIAMESAAGQGSRFTVSLPWDELASERPGTRPLRPLNNPEVHRALIVTESAPLAKLLGRYLHELGAEVRPVNNAAHAAAAAEKMRPDVILLDLRLSEGAALQTLAQIRSRAPTRDTAVILVSELDEITNAPAESADLLLMKPVTRQRLIEALWKSKNGPAAEPRATGPQPLILVAEHNPALQTIYVDHLTAKGYRVATATNGVEAVERAREARPDLVLLDIQLPEIDGAKVARQLRLNPNSARTPIIAITALTIPGDRERCLEAGLNEYLVKPVNLKLLAQTIETLLQGENQ